MKKALIVMPTYNERNNIHVLIPSIFKITKSVKNWDIEILVVDDSSPDGTSNEVENLKKVYPKLHLITGKKEGIGKAYIRGFTYGMENIKPDVMFEMDSDQQHNPNLLPQFLKKIDAGSNFVIGSRYIKGGSIPNEWTIDRKFYSIIGNIVARLGFMNMRIHDWTSGYRCISSDFLSKVIKNIKTRNGYVFQIALLDEAIKASLTIDEIPLKFIDRKEGISKFNSAEYIIDSIIYIVTHSTFIKFVIVGVIGFIIDFGIAGVLIYLFNVYKPFSNAISAEFAIISNFFLNNFWSFKHKKVAHRIDAYIKKLLFFNIVSSGSILFQGLGMYIFIELFGDHIIKFFFLNLPTWIIYKISIVLFVVIPYSYFMYNKVVWTKRPSY